MLLIPIRIGGPSPATHLLPDRCCISEPKVWWPFLRSMGTHLIMLSPHQSILWTSCIIKSDVKIILQCCHPDTFTVKNKHAMSIQVYSQKCYKHAFKLEVIQLFLVYICNHSIRMSHLGFCPLLRTSICPSKSLVWHMTSHWMATSGWKKGCKVGTHCKQSTGMARGWHKKSQESGWRGLEEAKLQLLNIQICIELGWIVVDII